MKRYTNALGQNIGFPVEHWQSAALPGESGLSGRYCHLVPLDRQLHAEALYTAFSRDTDARNWTYLPYGPFLQFEAFDVWLSEVSRGDDPFFYSIIDERTQAPVGLASYLRINPADGVIEVGHLHFSPLIQRSSISTEAMCLMMRQVFDVLGYRRYEWKCDALNEPSRSAALRLGFRFEGVFQQMTMYKGRSRDTAWFAVLDRDWPAIRAAYQAWFDPQNFDGQGRQLKSLSHFMPE